MASQRETILKTLLAVVALTCISFGVDAAQWHQYFENMKGVRFYIDTTSHVRLANGNVQAWQKREKEVGDGYLYLVEVDCNERRYRFKSISTARKTPENMKQTAFMLDLYKGWEHFEPNDLDEE